MAAPCSDSSCVHKENAVIVDAAVPVASKKEMVEIASRRGLVGDAEGKKIPPADPPCPAADCDVHRF